MKIAVFHNLPPGGAKRVLFEEVRTFFKHHELYLFELISTNESFLDIRPFFKKVYRFRFDLTSKLPGFLARLEKDFQNFVKLAALHKKIAKEIDNADFDVCLVHPDKLTQAPFLLKYLKTPSFYYCEELLRIAYEKEFFFNQNVFFIKKWYEELTRQIRKRIDRNNARSASLILVASRYIQKKVKEAYKRNALFCTLGVDINVFRFQKTAREKVLLIIGEKEKTTGYNFALEIINLISEKIRPDLNVIDFSNKKPRLTDKNLAKRYSKSLATLCTSYNEPFGLTALESMACGTPVLAVNEGGYKETVINGKTGFLLKRDPKEFAEKILYLVKHPEVAERMGKEGRKHVKKNFTWERHNECIEKELLRISKT